MARFNLDEYVDVQTRIVRFWSEYPDGRIDTQLMTNPTDLDEVVFRTAVYKHRDDLNPSATGWAQERAGGSGANQTSWVENCETSSAGRALANMGYATSQKDRPSREEMSKTQQAQDEPPTEPQRMTQLDVRLIADHASKHKVNWRQVVDYAHGHYDVDDVHNLTKAQGRELHRWISEKGRLRELNPSDEELAATSGARP